LRRSSPTDSRPRRPTLRPWCARRSPQATTDRQAVPLGCRTRELYRARLRRLGRRLLRAPRGDLLDSPLDSTAIEGWGVTGAGRRITVCTNPEHAYMEIAGIRLDTSRLGDPNGRTGPRRRPLLGSHDGVLTRHPAGF
jgi:hypothetical protein